MCDLKPKWQIFPYITKTLIDKKSQYANETLHIFLQTLPGNLQGPRLVLVPKLSVLTPTRDDFWGSVYVFKWQVWVGDSNGDITIINKETLSQERVLKAHDNGVTSLCPVENR